MEDKKRLIRRMLCGNEKCSFNFGICDGKQNKRCKQLGKSFINNMNDEQINYVISNLQKNVFFESVSGKWKNRSFGY